LYGPKNFDTWSLLDLILTVLGVVFAIVSSVKIEVARRREEDENGLAKYRSGADDDVRKRRPIFAVLTAIAAVFGIVLFIFTQDMRNPMVLIDWWTIAFAVLFVFELLFVKLTTKREKEEEEQAAFV
ncbi:MAG: hypothetical protein LBN34_03885, partial [Clostridiales Family XIII bacterium]|nr:hypothetical protein [Clostridiales Family XIII bacterium]